MIANYLVKSVNRKWFILIFLKSELVLQPYNDLVFRENKIWDIKQCSVITLTNAQINLIAIGNRVLSLK